MTICSNYLTDITTCYTNAQYWVDLAQTPEEWLLSHSTSSWTQLYRDNLTLFIGRIWSAVRNLVYLNESYSTPLRLPYYLTNCIGGGSIDMSDILNAMLAATQTELTQFVGITEAYMAAIWDSPFNEEMYAALARGFKLWG